MKENEISILINCPVEKVFDFTINPDNTPKWFDGIVKEEVRGDEVQIGTIYRNVGESGIWSEYEIIGFKKNELFELKNKNSSYRAKYSYKPTSKNSTFFTYYECVDDGELENPANIAVLLKLKTILE